MDLPLTIDRLVQHFKEQGLIRVRIDRWAFVPEPAIDAWYVELGTSHAQIRIRFYRDNKQYHAFDITMRKHLDEARDLITREIASERGEPT